AFSRSGLPRSPAASPSAVGFWRCSIARSVCGQISLTVNQMKAAKTMACANSVRLMFMRSLLREPGPSRTQLREQRVAGGEPEREADADDEGGVDQAEQQEHFRLQRVGELRLARGRFQEA